MNKDKRIELVDCACGCGQQLNKYDGHYRTRTMINGHNNRKYKDPLEYKKAYVQRTKESRRDARTAGKKARRLRYKDLLLERRGSKCVNCGVEYNGKNGPMFDLHHVNPKNKLFDVSNKAVQNHSIAEVEKEADKCVILCSNCHRLHHHTDLVPIDENILGTINNNEKETEFQIDNQTLLT